MIYRAVFLISALLLIAGPAAGREATYAIRPGDVLEISVWRDESLTRELVVPPDGFIAFPLIGDIDTSSLTVPMLRELVRQRLQEFVPDVTVTVLLLKSSTPLAYVVGKVNNPGAFPILQKTNVMQILAMAGGLTPYASSKNILILRNSGGDDSKIPFDYRELEKGNSLFQNIVLEDGDVLVVP